MRIAGIKRDNQFSPNHIGNDSAIFDLTVQVLEGWGHRVTPYSELQFLQAHPHPQLLFSMARLPQLVEQLNTLSQEGCEVVNSAHAVCNCRRNNMTQLLLSHHIPYPDSLLVSTTQPIEPLLALHHITTCWVKRGDHHALHREDVTFAQSAAQVQAILHEYAVRGITTAVINRHLVGDLVKFYGVLDTPFFYWFYPLEQQHSKFGHELINGKQQGTPFSTHALHQLCSRTAQLLQLNIYGGDCIVSPDGSIRIIDFNDWPSFAPCRDEAAPYIATAILKHTPYAHPHRD